MPRLTPQHYRILVKVFKKVGFSIDREEGDHIIMERSDIERPIVIPKYDEIGIDIIKANLRTAKITREEYFTLLSNL